MDLTEVKTPLSRSLLSAHIGTAERQHVHPCARNKMENMLFYTDAGDNCLCVWSSAGSV